MAFNINLWIVWCLFVPPSLASHVKEHDDRDFKLAPSAMLEAEQTRKTVSEAGGERHIATSFQRNATLQDLLAVLTEEILMHNTHGFDLSLDGEFGTIPWKLTIWNPLTPATEWMRRLETMPQEGKETFTDEEYAGWLLLVGADGVRAGGKQYAWNESEQLYRYLKEQAGTRRICFVFRSEYPGGMSLPLLKFWPVLFRLNRLSEQRWTFIPPQEIREKAASKLHAS